MLLAAGGAAVAQLAAARPMLLERCCGAICPVSGGRGTTQQSGAACAVPAPRGPSTRAAGGGPIGIQSDANVVQRWRHGPVRGVQHPFNASVARSRAGRMRGVVLRAADLEYSWSYAWLTDRTLLCIFAGKAARVPATSVPDIVLYDTVTRRGRTLRRLSEHTAPAYRDGPLILQPSPTGRRVLYYARGVDTVGYYVCDLDGSHEVGGPSWGWEAAWLPDGSRWVEFVPHWRATSGPRLQAYVHRVADGRIVGSYDVSTVAPVFQCAFAVTKANRIEVVHPRLFAGPPAPRGRVEILSLPLVNPAVTATSHSLMLPAGWHAATAVISAATGDVAWILDRDRAPHESELWICDRRGDRMRLVAWAADLTTTRKPALVARDMDGLDWLPGARSVSVVCGGWLWRIRTAPSRRLRTDRAEKSRCRRLVRRAALGCSGRAGRGCRSRRGAER